MSPWITNTYARSFAGHRTDTPIDYPLSQLQQGDADTDATVRSLVSAGNAEPITLGYYLEQSEGAWQVVDFAGFGVRMVENYKGQFRSAVASSGVEVLIKTLAAKKLVCFTQLRGRKPGIAAVLARILFEHGDKGPALVRAQSEQGGNLLGRASQSPPDCAAPREPCAPRRHFVERPARAVQSALRAKIRPPVCAAHQPACRC